MTNKAYIVANKQQEREVLEKLEQEGLTWNYSMKKITQVIPSHFHNTVTFPYSLRVFDSYVFWDLVDGLENDEIVFDGRKEEQMSEKYVVSQEFMNELNGWNHDLILEDAFFVNQEAINNMPKIIKNWWVDDYVGVGESNKRLISIIRYMCGANDFEVEKPKKWVVRSDSTDNSGDYWYVEVTNNLTYIVFYEQYATRFDTKEEAESWANAHQEVIEVNE